VSTPRTSPYIWVTWITKLLAADAHCQWAAWFRAHNTYEKIPSDFDQAKYSAEHGAMVQECVRSLEAEGWGVYVEDQNDFKLPGKTGATLAGKPDVVAVHRDGTVKVIDCKTGKPRNSDQMQVLVYMLVLPFTHLACEGKALEGELRYKNGQTISIPSNKVDASMRALFRDLMERVSGDAPLSKVPSPSECRFCDIPKSECPERAESASRPPDAKHDLF
jgi:CRISPR/Cas system-associated exonuclease Cas4 (RecB family)